MFYESELNLLKNTFTKGRVPFNIISLEKPDFSLIEKDYDILTKQMIIRDIFSKSVIDNIEKNTVYKLENAFSLSFMFFLLPNISTETLLILGPYGHKNTTDSHIYEICESMGINPKNQILISEYCKNVAIIAENSGLFLLLDSFCERIWQKTAFTVVDINTEYYSSDFSLQNYESDSLDETVINMRKLERRYELENQMLNAVSMGNSQIFAGRISSFSQHHFEMRTTDPLRNTRNYCIIMNTLLRKAAEKGGVHPFYIDRTSSEFAKEIEQFTGTNHLSQLMVKMVETYSSLVRKHSTDKYSDFIKNAIVIIDSDIKAPLNLKILSHKLGISEVYLSSKFKKEVGKTITEYIREKRLNRAANLLKTTNLQVQTVALHCGIEDVQYFSKIFKKQFGVPPKDYR